MKDIFCTVKISIGVCSLGRRGGKFCLFPRLDYFTVRGVVLLLVQFLLNGPSIREWSGFIENFLPISTHGLCFGLFGLEYGCVLPCHLQRFFYENCWGRGDRVTGERVGLIGSSSFVGERVRLLLDEERQHVTAFSRQGENGTVSLENAGLKAVGIIENWICLAPIWTLPEHFKLLEKHGAKRLVALSSTSRFSKIASPSLSDRELASRLVQGEEQVLDWARSQDCTVVILQPTLIYGLGRDKNITEIARVIQRFGFFPLFGQGAGLRQPVHVDDVAAACISALQVPSGEKGVYVLSGGEVLAYRTMVERVFAALGRRPRFLCCPLMVFSLAVRLANLLPAFKGLSTEMAVRMNKDQVFDHAEATGALGFKPRSFHLQNSDCI